MGSKSASKQLMEKAGVPLVPGYHGDEQDPAFLKAQADAIGYPVLIKASAGGGGKGMRIVESGATFEEALASCRREAASSFGDDRVLVEKYLLRPRHIEIQVFADTHGNVVHLFERDCSVQRRHQKVLGGSAGARHDARAPRADGPGGLRRRAGRGLRRRGDGGVHRRAQDGTFYFMEMNTRLQVEHPVTEMITGQDLVEWQLRVAAGERLPLAQEQLTIRGHALEGRIYAEDAAKGFLPSTGRLIHLAPPPETLHVRVDSGVEEGDEITPYYDPMIAKLIVWDEDRERACARMLRALAQYPRRRRRQQRRVPVATRRLPGVRVRRPRHGPDRTRAGVPVSRAGGGARRGVRARRRWRSCCANRSRRRARPAGREDPHSPWHKRDGWRLNSELFALDEVPGGKPGEGRRRHLCAGPLLSSRCGRGPDPGTGPARPERRAAGRVRRPAALGDGDRGGREAPCVPLRAQPSARRRRSALSARRRGGPRGPAHRAHARPGHRASCRAGAGREGRAAAHPGGHEDGAHDPRARRRRAQRASATPSAIRLRRARNWSISSRTPGTHGASPTRRRSELSDAASVVRPIARAER